MLRDKWQKVVSALTNCEMTNERVNRYFMYPVARTELIAPVYEHRTPSEITEASATLPEIKTRWHNNS